MSCTVVEGAQVCRAKGVVLDLLAVVEVVVVGYVAVGEGQAEGIVVRALQDRAAAVERSCRKLRRVNDGNEKGKDGEPAGQKSWPVWVCFICPDRSVHLISFIAPRHPFKKIIVRIPCSSWIA